MPQGEFMSIPSVTLQNCKPSEIPSPIERWKRDSSKVHEFQQYFSNVALSIITAVGIALSTAGVKLVAVASAAASFESVVFRLQKQGTS
jgi:hypothetical protein